MGNTTQYKYDLRGNLVKVTDAKGGPAAYVYDRAGRRIAEVSPENYDAAKSIQEMNRIEYIYDVMDRVKAKLDIYVDPGTGRWRTLYSRAYKYDAKGNIIKELDALGYEEGEGDTLAERIETGYGTVYTYDLEGKPVTMLDPVTDQRGLAYTTRNEYDAAGRKTAVTNANGVSTVYTYDDAGNVLSVRVKKNSGSSGSLTGEYTYDLAGRRLTETDGNRNTVEYQYNALGKERKVTYPGDDTIDSNEIVLQYNPDGTPAYKKDSMGRVELYTYDNQNRVLTFTEQEEDGSDSITAAYKYDKNGNKRYELDGNGNRRENLYDGLNRLIETSMTVEGTTKSTSYEYDANGNQTAVTDWLGNTYTSTYDPLNRLIEKADPYTTIQKLEYNDNSLQTKAYDALGNLTEYGYDRNGRLITTIDAEGHITNQTYDDVGNLQSKSDGKGTTTVYSYDEYNRLTAVTNAKGETTSYTYDLNGNMLTQTDTGGNTTTYEYNAANKPVIRVDHGGKTGAPGHYTYIPAKTEAYTYHADGSLKTKKDRNGKNTEYSYDIHGRPLSQQIGSEEIAYTYDGNGNQLTMTDATGVTERTYDAENRVLTKTVPGIGTIYYEYDILEASGGYSEKSTDPKGNVTKKVFDKTGRLKTVNEGNDTTSYDYYDNGSRESVVYPDGSREDYTYYDDNLLKTLVNKKADGTVLDSYSYTYDGAHNQTSKTDAKGITKYEYDSLNRLSKVTEPSGKTTTYLYDKAGNRTQETVIQDNISSTTTYGYNEQNRLTETVTTSGFVTEKVKYDYDNNGNTLVKVKETTKPVDPDMAGSFAFARAGTTTTREVAFMEYNVWNQMVKTIDGDKTLTYRYNGEGYRVEKAVNGQITRYMYEADKVILEVDGQGNETARNVYGSNLLMRTAGNEQYYYMYNGHGDVTALLGTNGEVAATYYYDAFGNITEETGEVKNPIRYAGYQYDEETGIYYLNARYYDPKIARFLTEDTYRGSVADPLSLNLYTYCHNEPLMYVDPTGHLDQWDEDRYWGDNDHDGRIDGGGSGSGGNDSSDDNDSDDDGRSDWNDPDSDDYMNPNAPGYGTDFGDDDDDDRDHNHNRKPNNPIDDAIEKLKREIDYREFMGEKSLANKAREILEQIEALKEIIGQQKDTDNLSLYNENSSVPNLNDSIALKVLAERLGNGDGSAILSAPSSIGITEEEIEYIANSYVYRNLNLVLDDEYYYSNSFLGSYNEALESLMNYKIAFDIGGIAKDSYEGKISLFDFFSSLGPADAIEYFIDRGIEVKKAQIENMGDYAYLMHDKYARKNFINIIDTLSNKVMSQGINKYEEDINNQILESKIYTKLYEIKSMNVNFEKSVRSMNMGMELIEETVIKQYNQNLSNEAKNFLKYLGVPGIEPNIY